MSEEKNKGGKPRSYTPAGLMSVAEEYFKYAEENPVEIFVASKSGPMALPKRYPVNIYDFCRFAGINRDTYYNYKKDAEYSDTCNYIDTQIKAAQYSGAITGEFNSNFVARMNDLAEKQHTQHSGDPQIQVNIVRSDKKLAYSESEVDEI